MSRTESGRELFFFKDLVSTDPQFRDNLISSLEIPTFGRFKQVMFYDVLQMLCHRMIKIKYNSGTIQSNTWKLRLVE